MPDVALRHPPPATVPSRRLSVLWVAAVLVFAAGVWAAWGFVVDDAFITFRYAQHLAAGIGPVWNPAGQRVEGFTDFAWVVWNALGAVLGIDLPVFAKITSVLCGLATLAMLITSGRRNAGTAGAVFAALTYLLFLPTYFHLTGGLETAAVAMVLLRLTVLGLRAVHGQAVRHQWEPPMLLLLCGMLRPEGVLAGLPALLAWLWQYRRSIAARWWTVAAVLVGAGYFGWRWQYYGQLLPNTFYVKFGNLAAGSQWLAHTAIVFAPLLLLTMVLLVHRATRGAGLLLCSTVLATLVTYAVSGPTMDYLDRFADHAFPVLCLGAALGARALDPRWLTVAAGTVAVAWTAVFGAAAPDLPTIANYGADLQRAQIPIGHSLAATRIPARARTLAVGDAGAIPYYSGWQSIDYIGLNDRAIAHGANPTAVVTAARPTVVIITSATAVPAAARYGMDNAAVIRGYREVSAVRMRTGYWQLVFVLPPYEEEVQRAVETQVTRPPTSDPDDTIGRWLHRVINQ